ncbi:hypothetical protein K438DRAFT_1990255 [Mycena galopus ATCC 62051]|nr:hypothetical protein K438DRAFT_1990255 [Mycena galopus ATCC 62051]
MSRNPISQDLTQFAEKLQTVKCAMYQVALDLDGWRPGQWDVVRPARFASKNFDSRSGKTSDPGLDFTLLTDFLPDVTIKFILENFTRFKSTPDISELVENIAAMKNQPEPLYHVVIELAAKFIQMRKDKAAAKVNS